MGIFLHPRRTRLYRFLDWCVTKRANFESFKRRPLEYLKDQWRWHLYGWLNPRTATLTRDWWFFNITVPLANRTIFCSKQMRESNEIARRMALEEEFRKLQQESAKEKAEA